MSDQQPSSDSDQITSFACGPVTVTVTRDEAAMGRLTAQHIIQRLRQQAAAGRPLVLWLMAAPSAFAFYHQLIRAAEGDPSLQELLRGTDFFQFDDYPISRQSPQFPATFRHLLEEHLYRPLAAVCGSLPKVHPLELTGGASDDGVRSAYRDTLLQRKEQGAYLLQLKGIGMDGHWGFHGAETPLTMEPGMITVPMNSQNIRQQMLDWPEFFPTPQDVPPVACTFNVPMFLLADEIVDNVPQASKSYSVLATYGSETVLNEVPSSAVKRHPCVRAYLTQAAAGVLLEFRQAREADPQAGLSPAAWERLRALWRDETDPQAEARNIEVMEQVLRKLEMLS